MQVLHFYKDLGRNLSPEVRLGGRRGFGYGVDVREAARSVSLEMEWCRFWGGKKKKTPQAGAIRHGLCTSVLDVKELPVLSLKGVMS